MAKRIKTDSQQLFINLIKDIGDGKILPVYFLCGDEQFFTDQIQDKLTGLVPPESRDFNFDLLYGQDVDPAKILDVARSYPMMGDKRLVIVREFFQSTNKNINPDEEQQENSGGSLDSFIPYFERPSKETVLVMHDFKKPNKNTRFYKALLNSQECGYFEFDSPPEHSIVEWISDWVRTKHNKEIERPAAEMLYQIVGTNLHKLSTELEKLATFHKSAEQISVKDVKSVVGFSREYTAFDLQNALFARNARKTMFIAEQILQSADNETGEILRIIALLHSSFTNIWQYNRLAKKNLSPSDIDAQMKVGNYRLKMIARDATSFRMDELPLVFEALLDADRSIKGFSKLDSKAIFVMMLKRILA